MSKYTTGEVAKLCGITVRTVQYYDQRSILIPSELTEGGRRLYSEEDVKKLRIICFLRDLDLPINTIAEILKDDDPHSVVTLLLQQHELSVKAELKDCQDKLESIKMLKDEIDAVEDFSVNSIGDIAHIMKNKDKLKKVRQKMMIYAIAGGAVEIATIALWIMMGLWIPFAISYVIVAAVGIFWLLPYYYKKISYICPECHEVFKPNFWEFVFANHTPKTRKLTCSHCNKKHWCVETYEENSNLE